MVAFPFKPSAKLTIPSITHLLWKGRKQGKTYMKKDSLRPFCCFKSLCTYSHHYSLQPEYLADIDKTILNHMSQFKDIFEETWVNHKCDVPGCGEVMVIDGDMKLTRRMCAAITSGGYKFEHAPGMVVTGCRNIPAIGKKFCGEHSDESTPSLPAEKLSTASVTALRESRKTEGDNGVEEDVFTINGIHGKRKYGSQKKEQLYVSWIGYKEEKTWEWAGNIPQFIRTFYANCGKEETLIPLPRIRHSKMVGRDRYCLLTWENHEMEDQYVKAEELVFPDDEDPDEPKGIAMTKCKTKKTVNKRFYRRTAGIMIGASPCGVIPLFEELYGCESLHQVHGRLGEFLAHTNSKIKTICYDDACHLVRYARNPKRAEYSEIAKRLSEMEYFVDKIHFLNHVDKFCQEFCNPYTESSGLKEVNTSICEQSFSCS